jgi:NAD+ diphosphatase
MKPFLSQLHPTPSPDQPALWFIFKAEELLLYKAPDIPIQLEETGFVSSSSNTKPGGFLRGKSLFSPLNSTGYNTRHPNKSRTFLRDNALTETSVLKGERYINTIPELTDISILQLDITQQHYLGLYGVTPCYVAEVVDTQSPPDGMLFQPLRAPYHLVHDEDLFLIACRAKQILAWNKTTQFCGHCGYKTQHSEKERAKTCTHCPALFYPQVAPVVLALVWRKNEILLARSPHFQKGIYSLLAGFVEPGETLEQAAAREVKEEVGVSIKNLTYFGSQPWPFPSNLMIGFMAEYDLGEMVLDPIEIEDAQWFPIDALPPLPSPISLSRRMIDVFLKSLK